MTSPFSLTYYVDAGVRVLSSPNLHANVIATDRRAVIGSANASSSSTIADEAVAITDDPHIVAAARKFIDSIGKISRSGYVFLDNATAIWQIGRAVSLPGIGGRNGAEPDFLPAPVTRMFLWHITTNNPASRRNTSGRPTPADAVRPRGVGGEVPARLVPHRHPRWAWAAPARWRPASGHRRQRLALPARGRGLRPIAIPHTRKAVAYQLRTRVDLEPIAVTDAEYDSPTSGIPIPDCAPAHRIASAGLRVALLGLWNL
nr:phosphatidylserine/phosphatidylglycerophosphate/cardiolipin synthase family protein [Rhodococcus sp. WAY2]